MTARPHVPTRREALRRGAALGGAALAAAAAPALARPRAALALGGDPVIVAEALALAQALALAYGTLLARPLAAGEIGHDLELLRRHSQTHAETLVELLQSVGGQPLPEPRTAADVDRIATPGLADVATRAEALAYAERLETAALASNRRAVGRLSDARLIQTVARIVAAEAQHLVLLRRAAGAALLAKPFGRGRLAGG